jgi:hypothetical protein
VYSGEWTTSQGFSTNTGDPGIVGRLFLHQIFHRWNGWPPFSVNCDDENRFFFGDGWNEYYDDKLLNKLEVFPEDWHFCRDRYQTYKREYMGTRKDVAVGRVDESTLQAGTKDWVFICYRKGALVAFLLDKEIQQATGGQHSLDDVVREIWRQYRYRKGSFDNDDILGIVNSVAGTSFGWFFDKYVWGNEPLYIPEFEGQLIPVGHDDLAIACDGRAGDDWSDVDALLRDPGGDTGKSGGDLTAVYVFSDGKYLYFRLDVGGEGPVPPQLDSVSAGEIRYDIYIESPEWSRETQYGLKSDDSSLYGPNGWCAGIAVGIDEIVEMAVPLQVLGYPSRIRVSAGTLPVSGRWADRFDDTGWRDFVVRSQ